MKHTLQTIKRMSIYERLKLLLIVLASLLAAIATLHLVQHGFVIFDITDPILTWLAMGATTSLTLMTVVRSIKLQKLIHILMRFLHGGTRICIVRREGEQTFIELLDKLQTQSSFSNVLGITYRNGDKIARNADRPFIEDLDSLPFPAHHLLPLENLKHNGKILFPLISSRGCVYWCDFCSTVRMFGRGYRMRSPKNVVDEMQLVHDKYGVDQVTFYDDAFTVDRNRVMKICDELQSRKLHMTWDCGTRVDMVDRELMKTMHAAGCFAVWLGVESGSEAILGAMNKRIKLDQTRQAYKTAHDVGLMTIANVVLGFPGETEQTARETIRFVKELNPDDVGFYVATPYPGTPMYEQVKKNGWLRITDFDKFDTAGPTFETPWLSMEKLAKLRYKAYQDFYLRPSYVLRMMRRGGTYGRAAVKTSGAYLLRSLHVKLS